MSDTQRKRTVSRVDGFAAVDLLVFINPDPDMWALMAVINVNSWDAERGDLRFDFIAELTGWGREKIGRVVDKAEACGYITTHSNGRGLVIEKLTAPMSWDEFNVFRAGKKSSLKTDIGKTDIGKTDISGLENKPQGPENQIPEVGKTDRPNSSNNVPEHPEQKENVPASPTEQKKENQPEKKQKTKKMIEEELKELEFSPTGKLFKKAHDEKLESDYLFTSDDLIFSEQSKNLRLTEDQIKFALDSFFNVDTSWHFNNGHVRFKNFIKNIQAYIKSSGKAIHATKAELERYYEPWDPRNPYWDKDDTVQAQQKKLWELEHGPWTPKPDWKPKG